MAFTIRSFSRINGDEPTMVSVPPRMAQKPIGINNREIGKPVRAAAQTSASTLLEMPLVGRPVIRPVVVPPGKKLEGGWLYAGTPAKPVEQISPARLAELHESVWDDDRFQALRRKMNLP